MADNNTAGSTSFIGDGNIIYNTNINAAAIGDLNYLNTNKPLKADLVTPPNQFTFTGASLLNPPTGSQLPATTISNFVIYVNGQYIPSAFASITSITGDVVMQIVTGSVGYSLEADDEVIAIGKFE
jgi:hypothetical protein